MRQILGPVWRYALLLSGSTVRIHKGIVVDWHRGDHRRPGRPSNTLLRFGIPAAGSLIPALVIAWFSLYASNDYGRAISAGFFGCLLGVGYALLLVKLFFEVEKARRGTTTIVYLVSWLWWMLVFGNSLLAGIGSVGD